MSLEAMVGVLRYSEATLGARLCLIALANYADESNCSCPSVKTIAAHARVERASAQRALRKLEADGEITTVGTSEEYGTTIYRIECLIRGGYEKSPGDVDEQNGSRKSPEGVLSLTANSDDGENNGSGDLQLVDVPTEFDAFMADYREVTGRTQTKGSTAARKLFAARRGEDLTLDELMLATRGAHGDEWMVKNGRDVPETILRGDKVTRYIALARQRGLDTSKTERRLEQGVPQVSFDGGETWETDWERVT